jgi:hypothetical protein
MNSTQPFQVVFFKIPLHDRCFSTQSWPKSGIRSVIPSVTDIIQNFYYLNKEHLVNEMTKSDYINGWVAGVLQGRLTTVTNVFGKF